MREMPKEFYKQWPPSSITPPPVGGVADSGHTQEVLQTRFGVLLGSIRRWSKRNNLRQEDTSAMLAAIGRSLRRLVSIEQRILDLEMRLEMSAAVIRAFV